MKKHTKKKDYILCSSIYKIIEKIQTIVMESRAVLAYEWAGVGRAVGGFTEACQKLRGVGVFTILTVMMVS